MSVRNFDSGDTLDVLDAGFPNPNGIAFTYVALIRPDTVAGGDRACMGLGDASGNGVTMACNGNGGAYADDDEFEGAGAALNMTTTDWWIFGMDKGAGAGTARLHAVMLGGGSPVHSNTASVTATSFTPDRFVFGHYPGGSAAFDGKFAVSAAWNGTRLTDSDYEDIATEASSAFLASLSPHEIWHWNQSDVADDVVGQLGTGADQFAISGTDVVEGVDPTWDYSLADEAVEGYYRAYGPAQLGSAAADLFTVPDGCTYEIRSVYANNPTGNLRKVTLSIGNDAAGTRFLDLFDVPAEDSAHGRRATHQALVAGEKVQGYADAASAVVLVIDGYLRVA